MSNANANESLANIATFCLGAITMYFLTKRDKNDEYQLPIIDEQPAKPIVKSDSATKKNKRPVRVYVDGCWDVMHSGHYNALRQAKALGDILVVGVHSDEEIERHKRSPVMKNEQRMAAVSACKWADEVVFGVPYSPSRELLTELNCDFLAHGDDIPIAANGHSAYHTVMDKLKIFKRTPGVSTTHLIQRLVDAAKYKKQQLELAAKNATSEDTKPRQERRGSIVMDEEKTQHIESTSSWSSFLASTSRISAFSNDRTPSKKDSVVYIDGVFDLFHVGHISALKAAKAKGTFLVVGLYDDETVRSRKGPFFPLMNLQERVLNVLSCKYVDDILIGAPWKITKQVLKSLNVKTVVLSENTKFAADEMGRYDVPKEMGMLEELETDTQFTTDLLMENIVEQQDKLERENRNRVQKAKQYVNDSTYVQEKSK